MNMKAFRLLFTVLIAFVSQIAIAQPLTRDMITSQIKEKVSILNDYQYMLIDSTKSFDVKSYYKKQALSLFVNQGDPFVVDSLSYSGSSITTSSIYRNRPITRRIKDYLQGLIEMRFAPIDLSGLKIPDFPNTINEDEIIKYGENQYRCTFLITREFAGYIDNTPVYKDITPYKYTVFLSFNKTIAGTEYNIYLNDLVIEKNADESK